MELKLDINKVLQEIANGLGVAVEKVYPILYKQAIIEGIYDVISMLFLIATWFFIYKVTKGSIAAAKKDYDVNGSYYSDGWIEHILDKYLFRSTIGIFYCVGLVVFGVLSLFIFPELIRDSITAFFNTDYFIINDLVNKLIK